MEHITLDLFKVLEGQNFIKGSNAREQIRLFLNLCRDIEHILSSQTKIENRYELKIGYAEEGFFNTFDIGSFIYDIVIQTNFLKISTEDRNIKVYYSIPLSDITHFSFTLM